MIALRITCRIQQRDIALLEKGAKLRDGFGVCVQFAAIALTERAKTLRIVSEPFPQVRAGRT